MDYCFNIAGNRCNSVLCHVSIYNYFCLDTSSHPHKLSIILTQVSIDSPEILINFVSFSTILKNVISKHFCMLLSKCVKLILMKTINLQNLQLAKFIMYTSLMHLLLNHFMPPVPFCTPSPPPPLPLKTSEYHSFSNDSKGCRKRRGHCGLIRLC